MIQFDQEDPRYQMMLTPTLSTSIALFAAAAVTGLGTAQTLGGLGGDVDEDGEQIQGAADIVFLGTTAGQLQDVTFEYNGAIDFVDVIVGFQSYDSDSWAADLAMALIDPNGNAVHWGGYDLFFNYENYVGTFPEEWRQSSPGAPSLYAHRIDLHTFGLEGDGIWTMRLMNGYSGSEGSQWGGQMEYGTCELCFYDCNGNGIDDTEDIFSGASQDCDSNGLPDDCQPDCDYDGIPDTCEFDTDGDFLPDDCEFVAGEPIPFTLSGPGGTSLEIPFSHNQNITSVRLEFEFSSEDTWTWASDLMVVITSTDGSAIEIGGWDIPSVASNSIDFPGSIQTSQDGLYSHVFNLPQRLEGEPGEWTISLTNGYSYSKGATWTGTIDVGQNINYIIDCNFNGLDDSEEIAAAAELDCDGSGIPDECEFDGSNDTNADGVLDSCQLECVAVIPFEFTGSSDSVTKIEFEFDGTLFAGSCIASFRNTTYDLTYAGDMTFAVITPEGKGVRFGGSNSFVDQYTTVGGFPGSWSSKQTGNYPQADIPFKNAALTSSGTWTLLVSNGWASSSGGKWSGEIELCRLGAVIVEPVIEDCDDNGFEDADDIAGGAEDCNGDGRLDSCEITDGAFDTNGNQRLDSCERDEGDLNLDGCVNGGDVGLFWTMVGVVDPPFGDLDFDGDVDIDDLTILNSRFNKDCIPLG